MIERSEILDIESPIFGGAEFGPVGAYERITGRASCVLDVDDPSNAGIVNLRKAPRDAKGRVAYSAEFSLIKPVDLARGNGWLFYDVPNRGNKFALARINGAPQLNKPSSALDAGNGFLMRSGFTLAWSAWQGDVPAGADRLVAQFPIATDDGRPITGLCRDEFIAEATGQAGEESITPLSERQFIARLSYPAASLDPMEARLTVRERERDPRTAPPSLAWRFLDDRRIEVTRPTEPGFDQGAIYEFVYRGHDPMVLGIGFAAVRDLVAHWRHRAHDNPLAPGGKPAIRHALGYGMSQSGRFLRELVHSGFNRDCAGRPVFDAIFPVVAGARGIYLNDAFAQPGRYSRQHEDHAFPGDQFPFTYATMSDPLSGKHDGLLERARKDGVVPKVIQLDTDSEIWAGRASLLATDCGGADIALPDEARLYLAASVQHAPRNPDPRVLQQRSNPLGYGALIRALVTVLTDWVEHGTAPPPSRFPRRADGTLITLEELRARFPRLPGVALPTLLNEVRVTDYSVAPPREGAAYPVFVGAIDGDGNGIAGMKHPLLLAPLGTHTGWNLRAAGFAEGDLFSISGSYIPFAKTAAERAAGDPRPSLEERYGSRAAWAKRLGEATRMLVAERLLLAEDEAPLLAAAEKSWDVFDAI